MKKSPKEHRKYELILRKGKNLAIGILKERIAACGSIYGADMLLAR